MPGQSKWTRQQLLVAFYLYCQIPFGKLHSRNPEIIKFADLLGRTPSALAMKLVNIASLDPSITATGRKGLKGASIADKAMWNEMQENWEEFANASHGAVIQLGIAPGPEILAEEVQGEVLDYAGGEKVVTARARVGQDFFRKSILTSYNYRCCISGLAVPQLLVASHIVPWRADSANRLNLRNGLCLSMLHDKAFDIGIITVSVDMKVRVSRKYLDQGGDTFFQQSIVSYHDAGISLPDRFIPDPGFLKYPGAV